MFCPNCGKEQVDNPKFCRNCGAELVQEPASSVNTSDAAIDPSEITSLQKAADYFSFQKSVKRLGTINIVLGIIGIIVGFLYTAIDMVNVLLILIGVFLLAMGIWAKTSQNLNSLLFSGIALCIMGVWNIVVTIINFVIVMNNIGEIGGPVIAPFALIWAGVQLTLGVDAFVRYRRFSSINIVRPDGKMIKRVDQIIKPILKTNPKIQKEAIQFRTEIGFTMNDWKGWLFNSYGILASKGGKDVYFIQPSDVEITDRGKFRWTKLRKAAFLIRGMKLKGTIDPEYLRRYELWKSLA